MALTLLDELAVVQAHQAGDPTAFAEIVRAYSGPLRAHALRRLNDPHAADDAVQETFLRAFRALPRFSGQFHLAAWLYRILNNVCVDEFDRRRRDGELVVKAGANGHAPATVDPPAEPPELDLSLQAALSTLPPTHREAIVQRAVGQLTYVELADRAGISEDNARARVHRARRALRRLIDLPSAMSVWVITGGIGRKLSRLTDHPGANTGESSGSMGQALTQTANQYVAAAPERVFAVSRVVALTATALPLAGAGAAAVSPSSLPPPPIVAPSTTTVALPSDTVVVEAAGSGAAVESAAIGSTIDGLGAPAASDSAGADGAATPTTAAPTGEATPPATGDSPAADPATPVVPPTPTRAALPIGEFALTSPASTGDLASLSLSGTVLVTFDGVERAAELGCRGEGLDSDGGSLDCRLKDADGALDLVLVGSAVSNVVGDDGVRRVTFDGTLTSRDERYDPLRVVANLLVADDPAESSLTVAPA